MDRDDSPEKQEKAAAEDARDIALEDYLRSIGATSLAAELSDLRFSNRVVEAIRFLDTHNAEVTYQEQLHDKIDERMLANQSHLFDKGQAYINFVVTLGYAGFFAIWNFVRDLMPPWDMKVVAVLLGFSLIVFIAWTLASMIVIGSTTTALGNILRGSYDSRQGMLEAILEQEKRNQRVALKLQKFWLPTFLLSALTGFLAGILLLAVMLADVLGTPFSFYDVWSWLKTH